MISEVLFERDILYPTGNINEPGSIHIQMLNPNKDLKIPVVIESKTSHWPVLYLDSIERIIQSDIFDRIFVDIRKNVVLYFKAGQEFKDQSCGREYVKVQHNGTTFESSVTDIVE